MANDASRLERAADDVAAAIADVVRRFEVTDDAPVAQGVLEAFDAGAVPAGSSSALGLTVSDALANAARQIQEAAQEQVGQARALEDSGDADAADGYLRTADAGEGPLPERLGRLQKAIHPIMDAYREQVVPLASTAFVMRFDPASGKVINEVAQGIESINDELGTLEDEYGRLVDGVREMRGEMGGAEAVER